MSLNQQQQQMLYQQQLTPQQQMLYQQQMQQPMQPMQQPNSFYAPQKTQQQVEIEDYYNKIFTKLTEIFNTNASGTIDPYSFQSLLAKNNTSIPKERIGDFFKHLLFYTYASTAAEISNHQEVNKQLEEIKATLKKLIKEEKPVEPAAVAPPSG